MELLSFMSNKKAFTLVEVLFAIAIIGVVAVLSITVLISHIINKDRAVRLKKAYNTLSNGYKFIIPKHGQISYWSDKSSKAMGEKFSKVLSHVVDCGTEKIQKNNPCVPSCPKIYTAKGDEIDVCNSSEVAKLRTGEGFSYAFHMEDPACKTSVLKEESEDKDSPLTHVCGTVAVDIYSQLKGSNFYGADLYLFYMTREGFVPAGLSDDKQFPLDAEKCNRRTTEDIPGCTARLLYEDDLVDEIK